MIVYLWEKRSLKEIGGKGFNLARLYKLAEKLGFNVPDGFIITTEAFEDGKIDKNELIRAMKETNILDKRKVVRSSATVEDSFMKSYAGMFKTIINVKTVEETISAIEDIWKSCQRKEVVEYGGENVKMAVIVQEFIDTDAAGVMFTKYPIVNEIVIQAAEGLCEGIVRGVSRDPDFYVVYRDLSEVFCNLGIQRTKVVAGKKGTKVVEMNPPRTKLLFEIEFVRKLANIGLSLEKNFGNPLDIEFGIKNGKIFIFQARPITLKGKRKSKNINPPVGQQYLKGIPFNPGKHFGEAIVVKDEEIKDIKPGSVVVCKRLWGSVECWRILNKAGAVIAEDVSLVDHTAVILSELGIPAVIGIKGATEIIKDGQKVFVDGDEGKIYIEAKGKIDQKFVPPETRVTSVEGLRFLEKITLRYVKENVFDRSKHIAVKDFGKFCVVYGDGNFEERVAKKFKKPVYKGDVWMPWLLSIFTRVFNKIPEIKNIYDQALRNLENKNKLKKILDEILRRSIKFAELSLKNIKDRELAAKLLILSSIYEFLADDLIVRGICYERFLKNRSKDYRDFLYRRLELSSILAPWSIRNYVKALVKNLQIFRKFKEEGEIPEDLDKIHKML